MKHVHSRAVILTSAFFSILCSTSATSPLLVGALSHPPKADPPRGVAGQTLIHALNKFGTTLASKSLFAFACSHNKGEKFGHVCVSEFVQVVGLRFRLRCCLLGTQEAIKGTLAQSLIFFPHMIPLRHVTGFSLGSCTS